MRFPRPREVERGGFPRSGSNQMVWPVALCAVVVLLSASRALAQDAEDSVPAEAPPVSATDGLRRPPRDAFQVDPAVGVPYRSIFRDTGAPYTRALRPLEVEPHARVSTIDTSVSFDLPDPRGRFPLLDRGFEPEDADLKLGPLYFKLRALTLGVLYSDNVNRTEDDREADVIGIVRLGGSAVAQLSEGFRVSVAGNFVWLPFEGKIGIAGFGLVAPYSLGLEGIPVLDSQVTWETRIGEWDVVIADDFKIRAGRYALSDRDDFDLFEGGRFDEEDRAGRYSFRVPLPAEGGRRHTEDLTESEIIYYSNTLSGEAMKLVPGPTRVRVGAYHENLWYNQGRRGLPSIRDGAYFTATSERENLRFKPFFSYRTRHTNNSDGWSHETRLGINGPITDQLDLHADAGWFHRDNLNRLLWDLELRHDAGPYTQHSLLYSRQYTDIAEELVDAATYRIRQILGPRIRGEAFASYVWVEDLADEGFDRDEFITGVRLTLYPGPRTTLRLSGLYRNINGSNEFGSRETWTGRLELTYRFTDTLLSRFIYQYQERAADRSGSSYYENFLYLTVTKYFD